MTLQKKVFVAGYQGTVGSALDKQVYYSNKGSMPYHINVVTGIDCMIRDLAETKMEVQFLRGAWNSIPANLMPPLASLWT